MFAWITALFKPAADLVDELNVSVEEKGKLVNELAKIQAEVHEKSIDLMKVEASSQNFLVATWRPICSIGLILAILMDGHFGFNASEKIYDLANIFLGVYGGGRSLEKIMGNVLKK